MGGGEEEGWLCVPATGAFWAVKGLALARRRSLVCVHALHDATVSALGRGGGRQAHLGAYAAYCLPSEIARNQTDREGDD